MENLWQQEYASHITEWKSSQTESQLLDVKNYEEVKSHNVSKCVQMSPDDNSSNLDLILADSLLEKAKNIRTKNKKHVNGCVDNRSVSTFCTDKIEASSKHGRKHVLQKVKAVKTFPHNKSDFVINNQKKNVVPGLKSASKPFMPKNSSKTVSESKSTALLSKTSVVNYTDSTFKDCDVILSKNLDKLKNLQLNLPSYQKSEGTVALPLGATEKTYQHRTSSYTSSTEFLSQIKDRLNAISSEVKVKLWYPFLSPKSDAFLTSCNCDSYSSLKKVYSILYSIQETMMWIDLLHLLEMEICPNLIVDPNNMNSLRICSYLRSIFHPNSQRIPIVFPHSAVK